VTDIFTEPTGFWSVRFESLLAICIGGIATVFGAYWGARKAGERSVEAVRVQIDHSDNERRENTKVREDKYQIFLSSHLNIIYNNVNSIVYFSEMILKPSNNYNVDPVQEIEKSILRIKEVIQRLLDIDPSYISKENYVLIGNVNSKIFRIENSVRGYLASVDDEANSHLKQAISYEENLKKYTTEHASN